MEEEEKKVSKFELVKVPTEFTTVIQTPDNKNLTIEQGIVEILNKLEELRKTLL